VGLRGEGALAMTSRTDARCDALTKNGTPCKRTAIYGRHEFQWCWQHMEPWTIPEGGEHSCSACDGAGTVAGHDHGRPFTTLCGWCGGRGKEPCDVREEQR
jgi:hypothetical protein